MNPDQFKICSDCKILLDSSFFCKSKHSKDGLQVACRKCASARHKQWRLKNSIKTIVPPDRKTCSRCRVEKASSAFCRESGSADGLNHNCRECSSFYSKRYQGRQPKSRDLSTRKNLWEHYRLTPEDYAQLLRRQEGKCGICFRALAPLVGKKSNPVDHCHRTGRIRGILCAWCNGMLHAVENQKFLAAAQLYLQEHGPTPEEAKKTDWRRPQRKIMRIMGPLDGL